MEKNFELDIPKHIILALGLMDREVAGAVKMDLAVHYFQQNSLSFGQARMLSGLSVWDFMEVLKERKVPLHYGETEYEEDSKTIEEFC